MTGLPDQVRYLANYLQFLRTEHCLDESTDTSALFEAVNARVSGLDDAEARAALQEDALVLERCNSAIPEVRFVQPFFEDPADLLLLARKPRRNTAARAPRRRSRYVLQMQMPAGFISRREGRGLFAQREGSAIIVAPATKAEHRSILELASLYVENGAFSEVSAEEVTLGAVKGYRLKNGAETKSLLLAIDGRYATITLQDVSESELLHCIQTLAYAKEI